MGRKPDTSAALAIACVDVGPVINRKKPMKISFTVTKVQPACRHKPARRRMTPADSVTDAACRRAQKSGNLRVPIAPTVIKNVPPEINAQLKN